MSRTDVTAPAAGAASAQRSVVAAAWRQTPSAAPGMFRVRPLPGEATASYVQRLAVVYQLTLPQFLDGAGITLHRHGTLPAAELRLNHTAARHLAALAPIPLPHLTRALPRLAANDDAHHTAATAHWKRLEAGQQPVRACTLCTRHRSHGATDTPGFICHHNGWCARGTTKQPPAHGSPPPSRPGLRPNSPPPTTTTSASYDTPAPPPHGPRHAPSPPAGTTTTSTSPTAGDNA
ncbi:TniQ family protein [Streptomyces sp. NPDC058676]|uniref:TniQ family protein n=1 Tax=unclassified Streptomyces TaxID=2593676 RepID=UPI00364D40EC